MSAQRHVIRRECIDLAVEGEESEGFALQHKLSALCRDWLALALDEALARAVPPGEHWQFERIEVDAGCFTPEAFEQSFVAAVADAVEAQVRARQPQARAPADAADTDQAVRLSGAQSMHEAFLYFLRTGALPWWCHLPEGRTLAAAVAESWSEDGPVGMARATLLKALAEPVARRRLARQFPAAFLHGLLERLAPGAPALVRELAATAALPASAARIDEVPEAGWVAAFACLAAAGAITRARLRDAWTAIAPAAFVEEAGATTHADADASTPAAHGETGAANEPGATTPDTRQGESMHPASTPSSSASADRMETATAASPVDLEEGVFIDCAGVVLLHPYLPILFQRLALTDDGRLVQPDRALALLHFLATGETTAPEYALLLPKLLCGLEPTALAGAPVVLEERETHEAMELLRAAIGHWGALGDASPDALRGNFLVRPGKLSRRGDEDLLQVERQAYDVLLARLPWSIGAVGLPWMKRLLWVEWA